MAVVGSVPVALFGAVRACLDARTQQPFRAETVRAEQP
jgi:hypothetical protein